MENTKLQAWHGKSVKIGILCLLAGVLLFCTVILFPIGFVLAVAGAAAVILGTTAEYLENLSQRSGRPGGQLEQ